MAIKTENGISHEGMVIETREENYHDDSDFYAIVWDEENQKTSKVYYATTRAYTYNNWAKVDASPEVVAKAQAYTDEQVFQARLRRDKIEASEIAIGKVVKVVRGRKVALGTVGKVFHMQDQYFSPRYRNGYKQGPDSVKVGIALDDEKACKATIKVDSNVEIHCPWYDESFRLAARRAGAKWDRIKKCWYTTEQAQPLIELAKETFSSYVNVAWTYANNLEVVNPEDYYTDEASLREASRGASIAFIHCKAGLAYI